MERSLRVRTTLAAGVILTCAWAAPVTAQPVPPGQEGELGKLLAPVHDRKVCFARTYDAAHMKRHPKQKVTALLFQMRYHRHDPEAGNPEGQRNYYFAMAAKVRGQKKTLYASGECTPGKITIHCGVECDGGGVDLQRTATGGIEISYSRLIPRIRMTAGCDGDEDDTVDLTPGTDDKVFRLDKATLSACRSLDDKL